MNIDELAAAFDQVKGGMDKLNGPLGFYLKELLAAQKALLATYAPIKVGDRFELRVPPELIEGHGWWQCRHFMIVGARGEVKRTGISHEGVLHADVMFDKESRKGDGGLEYPSEKYLYRLKMDSIVLEPSGERPDTMQELESKCLRLTLVNRDIMSILSGGDGIVIHSFADKAREVMALNRDLLTTNEELRTSERKLATEVAELNRAVVDLEKDARLRDGLYRVNETKLRDQLDQSIAEITKWRAAAEAGMPDVVELMSDRKRLNLIENRHLQVCFNDRHGKFVIQEHNQVVGHIGDGMTLRAALDMASEAKP